MTDYLESTPPPASKVIPVTLGADVAFSVQRKNTAGTPVNFDAGSQVYLQVALDRNNPPTKVQAVVSGSTAAIRMDYLLADQCKNSTKWQLILKNGSAETALLVGRFERNDG